MKYDYDNLNIGEDEERDIDLIDFISAVIKAKGEMRLVNYFIKINPSATIEDCWEGIIEGINLNRNVIRELNDKRGFNPKLTLLYKEISLSDFHQMANENPQLTFDKLLLILFDLSKTKLKF